MSREWTIAGATRALMLAAAVAPGSVAEGTVDYVVTDVGTLGGPFLVGAPGSGGTALNASGQVVGHSLVADDEAPVHAFLWDGATMVDLAPAVATDPHSLATAVNDAGDVVGVSYRLGKLDNRAMLWSGGSATMIGLFMARDVNAAGIVAGEKRADTYGAYGHAVRWQNGTLTDLGTLGGLHSSGYAINDQGDIVGVSSNAAGTASRATLWRNGTIRDLGTLGGANSFASDINAAGDRIVGAAETAGGLPHAFRFAVNASGAVTARLDLGVLAGDTSFARAINAAGIIVGSSDDRAFRWSAGTLADLNDLISAASGWTLIDATAINDAGQITGRGLHDGHLRAFLLTPGGPPPGDVDGDGIVGFNDFVEVLASWGACGPPPSPCPADLDGDGEVTFFDLLLVLGHWE